MPRAAARRRFMLAAAAGLLAPHAARAGTAVAALDAARRATRAPGAVTAVVRPGAAPQLAALGHADLEGTRPMTTDLHFRIGSVAKLFAGTAVLRLADAARLDVDSPISRYVEGVPQGSRITLDMLGRHTSGLFNPIESRDFQAAIMTAPSRIWTDAEILADVVARPPAFAAGTRWRYSNANTLLLAMAAERAADERWPDLLRRLVLDPLDLAATGMTPAEGLPQPAPRGYRYGRRDWPIGYGDVLSDATVFSASWAGAAGNMHSTAADLARAAVPLASGALLSAAGRARLHDWQPTGQRGERHGFHVFERDGRIGHAGDVPGFSAALAWDASTGTAVAALANLSNTPRAPAPAIALVDAAFAAQRPA